MGGDNFADSLSGVQIGVFNQCMTDDGGVQFGIFNFCAEECRQFGLVNINQHSRLQMLVTTGNHDLISLALRIRNRHTYNVIGFGVGRDGMIIVVALRIIASDSILPFFLVLSLVEILVLPMWESCEKGLMRRIFFRSKPE